MAKIEKIYKLTLEGEYEMVSKMNTVNKTFDETKKKFKEVKEASKGIFINSEEIQTEKDNLHQLTIELVKQQQESKKLQAESVALRNAKRALSNEELKEQQSVLKTYEAYQKLQKQYLNSKKEAQGLGAQYGINSSQFKIASAEAQKYYQKLVSLDKAVGVFTRNVGNYPNQAARYFSESIKKNFDDMKGQMTQFAVGYLSFQGLMNLGSRIKTDVIAFDSYNNAIDAVSQKTGDLAVNQNFVIGLSERLGTQLLATGNSFKSFFAAYTESGGGAQQARDIYEAAAESAAVLKLSQDQANGVMLTFSQIASKGKVQAEELRGQIGERLPGAFGIAARAMGVTTSELDKMMRDGKLLSNEFLPKFAKELKNTFGNGGKEVQGMQAQMNRLDNIISKVGSNKSFITFVSTMVSLISFLAIAISKVPFSVWLSFVGLLTLAYWANIQAMVAKNAVLATWIIRMGIGNALIGTATAIERGHALVIGIVNGAYRLLIVTLELMGISTVKLRSAWIAFNAILTTTPLSLVLVAVILAVSGAMASLSAQTSNATVKLKEHGKVIKQNADLLRVTAELNNRVSETVSGQIGKIATLTATIKSNSISLETKKRALDQLIAINPKYLEGLTLENFHTAQGTKLLNDYKNKLLEVAKAKAVQQILDEKSKRITELEMGLEDKRKASSVYENSDFFSKTNFSETGKSMLSDIGIGEGSSKDKFVSNTKELSQLLKERSLIINKFSKEIENDLSKNKDGGILGGAGMSPDDITATAGSLSALEAEIKGLSEQWKSAKIESKEYYDIQAKLKAKQDQYDALTKDKKDPKGKTYRGARLTGDQRDYIKDLEAEKNQELAIIERSYVEGKMLQDEYIKKSNEVNQKFFADKIKYLKGGNAEERKQVAQAELDRIKAVKESNDRLYTFYKKQNDDELSQETYEAERKRDLVLNNIYSLEQDKIKAELEYQDEAFTARFNYNQKMIDLEISLSKNMIEEANERARILQEQNDRSNANRLQSQIRFTEEALKEVDRRKEQLDNEIEINNAVERRNILENRKLNLQQKNLELQKLSAQLELSNINTELGSVNAKIMFMTWELTQRKLTNDELIKYNLLLKEKAILEGNKAQAEINVRTTGATLPRSGIPGSGMSGLAGAISNGMKDSNGQMILGSEGDGGLEGKDYSEQIGYAIAESFDMAKMAMESYFDAERQRIERSRQLAYERIDLERAQSQRYAQSASEREAIDKEANAKKKKADRQAGEQLKKTKKAEARINFLMELGSIWASVMQLGPIAGPIFGAVLSTLATVRFGMTMSGINKEQFAKGGIFGRGGRLNGPSHSNGGMPVYNPETGDVVAEMEGNEGIINKKSMADNNTYTVTGKPSQIASKINAIGGGVDWFGGATLNKYATGGLFNWNRAKPPVFNSQRQQFESMNENPDSERLDRIEGLMEDLAKEQFKKVVVSSKDMTNQQKETAKQTEIGTL